MLAVRTQSIPSWDQACRKIIDNGEPNSPKMTPPETIHFVYRKPKWGSTIMRIFQLSDAVSHNRGGRETVRLTRMPDFGVPGEQYVWAKSQPNGGVYFFSKSCLSKVKEGTLRILRRKGGKICFDLVDQDLLDMPKIAPDLYVCTSFAQKKAVERLIAAGQMAQSETYMLLHNNDVRLDGFSARQLAKLRPIYVGMAHNLLLPQSIANQITIRELDDTLTFEDVIPELPDHNFHFAVRPGRKAGSEIYKPFLKGFVAAACQSNIMVLRETDDAEVFLGENYPYLVETPEASACAEVLKRAEDDFGGPEWMEAIDRMSGIKDQVSPGAVARKFEEMVRYVSTP